MHPFGLAYCKINLFTEEQVNASLRKEWRIEHYCASNFSTLPTPVQTVFKGRISVEIQVISVATTVLL